ncbi:MAG: DUF3473 domain-containing protein [bacterium]|nr:DUF3473 domain-containing protein [bacterium]
MTVQVPHTFSIDVEDWFQVFYGESIIDRASWPKLESKIAHMVDSCLSILEETNTKTTFFFVGWISEFHPELVRKVERAGHEIACHSYWHKQVFKQTPTEFKEDTLRAKKVIEDTIGRGVAGYRAPGYSILKSTPWAIDIIEEAEFIYDSSLLFLNPAQPKLIKNNLIEIPPNSLSFGDRFLPVNGGFVFRSLPYWAYALYLKILKQKNTPLNFYTHSWEIYSDYPRIPMTGKKKFIQYYNIASCQQKLSRLLKDMKFSPLIEVAKAYSSQALKSSSMGL